MEEAWVIEFRRRYRKCLAALEAASGALDEAIGWLDGHEVYEPERRRLRDAYETIQEVRGTVERDRTQLG
jgi:hypothetical protein